jgi:hypothetical protein
MPSNETYLFADDPPQQQNTSSPELEKLLDWLINHWSRPSISLAQIYCWGPHCVRNNKTRAMELAGILTEYRWLERLPSRRRDRQEWQINRGPTPIPLTDRISTTTT